MPSAPVPALLLPLLLSLAGCGGGEGQAGGAGARKRPPQLVGTMLASAADFAPRLEALGTVTPLQTVAVRARADGEIVRILFREGDQVRTGQVLMQLDDRAARAALAQARATLAGARATSVQATANYERATRLVTNGFVSGTDLDIRKAAADNGRASIAGAAAAVAAAETQLSFLTIRAPVSGRTGELNFRLGANVRAGDTLPLVTINQLSPIQVRFPVSPEQIQAVRMALQQGVSVTAGVQGDAAPAAPIATGRLAFLDNNVDPGNGSVAAKAQFENAGDKLWPGAIVTIRMPLATPQPRIALPEAAVQVGRDAPFVWAVAGDGKIMMRDVGVAGRADGRVFLASGVSPGERIVIDTLSKLKPGDKVRFRAGPGGAVRAANAAPAVGG
jgi:RND family efflux transporter MFP subunit